MRVGVPFPLKTKARFVTAGILVPFLVVLNAAAWVYESSLPIERLASILEGLPGIDWTAAYPSWLLNSVLSVVILLVGLAAAEAWASLITRRIVRLIEAAERFEDDHFAAFPSAGGGSIAALEERIARMGRSLALLRRFVNKNAVDLVRKNLLPPSAESHEVTLAVFKINNYPKLVRLIDPERPETVNELVNKFLARIAPSITKTGGSVNTIGTIGGFYVLAVWGNASLTPNLKKDAVAALRTCVLVRSVVKILNRDMRILAERTGCVRVPQFDVSMGLDSGEALVGPMGADGRKEYRILGEVVKNAVRSAGIGAKTGKQIVMTERTFNLGGASFVTRELLRQLPRQSSQEGAVYFSLVKPLIGIGDEAGVENVLP
jgi:class 3 adenylate cyclase